MKFRFGLREMFSILLLVPAVVGRKWKTRSYGVDIVKDSVTAQTSARSVLSCARFCKESSGVLHFFFSKDDQQCYCGKKHGAFTDNPSGHVGDVGTASVKDCSEYHTIGFMSDGVYTIEPNPGFLASAWCDMRTGGWTVIQRRLDGSVDFYRNWTEYVNGFGDKAGEYWLGLDQIHYLTKEPSELFIYMGTFGDNTQVDGFAHYSFFSIANSSMLYRLNISMDGYTGNVHDALDYNKGMKFTTFDNDNDLNADENCAAKFEVGGWWMNDCSMCNLNGQYLAQNVDFFKGVFWNFPWGYHYSLKKAIMMVKRKN